MAKTYHPCNLPRLSFRASRGIPALLKYFIQPQRQFSRLPLRRAVFARLRWDGQLKSPMTPQSRLDLAVPFPAAVNPRNRYRIALQGVRGGVYSGASPRSRTLGAAINPAP
jgi:hypothetical protein